MAAQKRSSHRNYIGLVEDEDGERRAAEMQPSVVSMVKDYLLGLIATMRSARSAAR